MGRLHLRIVLIINATFACLAAFVMGVEVFTKGKLSPSLGILAITYLIILCCLALGADWARIVSAGISAVVVIASLLIISSVGGFNIITFVSLTFALIFFSSAYLLYFSKSMQAELEKRRIWRLEARPTRQVRL